MYRATVVQQSASPGAVRVTCPALYGTNVSGDVFPAHGTNIPIAPANGSTVWIMLENDDKQKPLWVVPNSGLGGGGGFSDVSNFTYNLAIDSGSSQVTFSLLWANGSTGDVTADTAFGSAIPDHLTVATSGIYFVTFNFNVGSGLAFAPVLDVSIYDNPTLAPTVPARLRLANSSAGQAGASYAWMGAITAAAKGTTHGISVACSSTAPGLTLSYCIVQRFS